MKPLGAALVALLIAGLLAATAGFAVMYSGLFNVAATVEDSALLSWVLVTTREASIQYHAEDIQAPSPGGQQDIDRGFAFFRDECAMCHTPPGRQITSMSKGLNPAAPQLTDILDMSDPETFWVTKSGIRFTGMPAWSRSHDDKDIWDVVRFMRSAENMKPSDYDALDKRIPQMGMN